MESWRGKMRVDVVDSVRFIHVYDWMHRLRATHRPCASRGRPRSVCGRCAATPRSITRNLIRYELSIFQEDGDGNVGCLAADTYRAHRHGDWHICIGRRQTNNAANMVLVAIKRNQSSPRWPSIVNFFQDGLRLLVLLFLLQDYFATTQKYTTQSTQW